MLLVEVNDVKKYFAERLIIDVDRLKIYNTDRIGVVGVNGAGKTTLLDILSKRLLPDEGTVKLYGKYSYVSQFAKGEDGVISEEMASKFEVPVSWCDTMSGGEKTRFKIARALTDSSPLLFADEPTSNVDVEGIELLEQRLLEYVGGLVVISHDRNFLDRLCNKIIEVESGKVKVYSGNYSQYMIQKQQEQELAQFQYHQYMKEKRRLERAMIELQEKSRKVRKAPKRMGNSEARLHKMGDQRAKASLGRAKDSIASRLAQLPIKKQLKNEGAIQLRMLETNRLYSKILIEAKQLSKQIGGKALFHDTGFQIENGRKVALIGKNGCGKSTLLKMIVDYEAHQEMIRIATGVKIGYFSQEIDILQGKFSIMENVMDTSVHPETFVRTFLARLLFKGDTIDKQVDVLSGGERVKVAFAKILLQDINLLILDEPTNYLDLPSMEVIEQALKACDLTVLFVSHDRRLIDQVADRIMTVEKGKVQMFMGNYREYLEKQPKKSQKNLDSRAGQSDIDEQMMVLQNRLSDVIGKLSTTSKKDELELWDREYKRLMTAIKQLHIH